MGFKDAERAYAVEEVTGAAKVVLVAISHRTDDRTHKTIVGQSTIAAMIGAGGKTVQRALGALEDGGWITRSPRFRKDGPRTSDEITVKLDQRTDRPQVDMTTGRYDQESDSPRPTDSESPTTGQIVPAYKDGHSEGHSEGNSVPPMSPVLVVLDRFDDFYSAWPRKVAKPAARKAWDKAIQRADPATIIAAAIAYRDNPGIPDTQYIPHASTWLNQDRWNDQLPRPAAHQAQRRPTRTEQNMSVVERFAAQEQLELKELTS